ncbi:von Willebrand factor A domain-containing protein 8 [Caerostris darwini]|uniref:von Willebrand factor A domain-containing protein 8 n=1 Tax=Caerostris darwini TaxID=1538125 RepID=A0AAV4S6C6_9ARAC|nr:von Willebrand factor A domain-containing protein 8 [Caerostris darwini]
MSLCEKPAFKLLINQCMLLKLKKLDCQKNNRIWDFRYKNKDFPVELIWIQGKIRNVSKSEDSFLIDDGTGNATIVSASKAPGYGSWITNGQYIMVIGEVLSTESVIQIRALKLTHLHGSNVEILWKLERHLYISAVSKKNKIPDYKEIKIGSVSKPVKEPKNPVLVPIHYFTREPKENLIHHLQWILKKDLLGQDMFLIGLPGPLRSRVILQYLEMMHREVEYVVLSRDTTENDLKQRREIFDGSAHYVDQSAVKAAIEGRFLILDGVEKVERNVLPVLNNLLENREMQLEDGRFLVAPEKYDQLLKEYTPVELNEWKLVRVSENFRVVALGLPVPHFKGNPLDPPFRSRFQARHVIPKFEEQFRELSVAVENVSKEDLKNFLSACHTFLSNESINLGMPRFPVENVSTAVQIWDKFPSLSMNHLFHWMYPYTLLLSTENQNSLIKTLEQFSIRPNKIKAQYKISQNQLENVKNHTLNLEIEFNKHKFVSNVLGYRDGKNQSIFISNPYHENVLANFLMTHTTHDFCIIGDRGCGKATLIRKFASLLNYPVEMIMLYNDMTARDLLQQRITDDRGNTLWRSSKLVEAAEDGKLLVLDGLHRLHSSIFSVLQRLVHDREMQLYDGTRLLRHDRYDSLKQNLQFSDQDMRQNKILRIHPAFRIVALAEPPKLQSTSDNWMNPQLLSIFHFHAIRPLSLQEEKIVIQGMVGRLSEKIHSILQFTHKLRNSEDDTLRNVSASFSTRQLVRMARRLSSFPDESIYGLITQSCLMKFLPSLTKQAVENLIESCGIENTEKNNAEKEIGIKNGTLKIGNTSASIYKTDSNKVKVPNIVFYNSREHSNVMEAMLQDFLLGEHLLLVGNQGVGKNKITDRFLQLLNRPREYIQLHRDTTVQSLTQQPTVVDCRIVYEDSPLLRAVQHGRVLVVDEADKAPTHVTSILKALVVSGEMNLSDGRCIVHHTEKKLNDNSQVVMHPDFRMIVLANRPGFPFLGNDFFAVLGDIFSCHAVDNPSLESEVAMLRQYGPNVSEDYLRKLASLFGELRSLSDAGLITYPYSTREVVNIIKHLNKFHDEGIPFALKNVFDFDSYNTELKETLNDIFKKHGIPTEKDTLAVQLASSYKLPKECFKAEWKFDDALDIWLSKSYQLHLANKDELPIKEEFLTVNEVRGAIFSELQNSYQLPITSNNIPLDIAGTKKIDDIIYIATANPVSLFTVNSDMLQVKSLNLSNYFPSVRTGFKPMIKMSVIEYANEELVLLHESVSNQTFLIHPTNGLVYKINFTSAFEETLNKISSAVYAKSSNVNFRVCSDLLSSSKAILYAENSTKVILLDFTNNMIHHTEVPQVIMKICALNENSLLLRGNESVFIADISNPEKWEVRKFSDENIFERSININIKTTKPKDSIGKLNASSNLKYSALMSNSEDYASLISGSFLEDKTLKITSFPREKPIISDNESPVILPSNNQLVRFIHSKDIPEHIDIEPSRTDRGCLEIVDMNDNSYGYIVVDLPHKISSFCNWLLNSSKPYLLMTPMESGKLITVDAIGCIRKWEIKKHSLQNSYENWKRFTGLESEQQATIEYVNQKSLSAPKHGKIDSTGAPHVGGNMWAGGTGGRDTAGLGGRGGPYRLDAGHNVFQVSDQEKEKVPQKIKEAARLMAMEAYKKRLKEIKMSEYDAELYDEFLSSVDKQVKSLRLILDNLQAKSKDRQWMKHQTSGELDDTKLIEGITGEKSIYKKRGEQEPEVGSPQQKPKLLRLVVDVSGSMYRFNGHDNRLQRELESVVLVMEAFHGYKEKFQYEIVGHSGEDFCIQFSKFDEPPKNPKERLELIRNMHAHTQFCMSGDNTLEATNFAIKTITKEDADEYFVIVMSDANFDRYGISPCSFAKLLTSNPKVNAFAIFIGSLGDQAAMLSKQLPAGRTFMCFDSSLLTQILQKIFTSALLKD